MPISPDRLDAILKEFGLPGASLAPLGSGLINLTFGVDAADGRRLVLQRVNPIFPPEVNRDIDVLTRHLSEVGMVTPMIVPTRSGAFWLESQGEVWRLVTHVAGVCREALDGATQAEEAGRLLAEFHRAVGDLDHVRVLERALSEHRDHARFSAIEPLAREILEAAGTLPELPTLPDRVVHGDPKINNIIFDDQSGRALCLVDLDTIGRMPLSLELGDAFRSWCNPAGEDIADGQFSADLFEPALRGYAAGAASWIDEREWRAILPATHTILIELAARFCADALNENYFGWAPERFVTRSEHNQVRAAGQLAAARSLQRQEKRLQDIIERCRV
jgi:Ser/Thr protein kinase RdoA (MazF antagonist)